MQGSDLSAFPASLYRRWAVIRVQQSERDRGSPWLFLHQFLRVTLTGCLAEGTGARQYMIVLSFHYLDRGFRFLMLDTFHFDGLDFSSVFALLLSVTTRVHL